MALAGFALHGRPDGQQFVASLAALYLITLRRGQFTPVNEPTGDHLRSIG
jgi:hypothetical protein